MTAINVMQEEDEKVDSLKEETCISAKYHLYKYVYETDADSENFEYIIFRSLFPNTAF